MMLMITQANKTVVRRYIDLLNLRNVAILDEPRCVLHHIQKFCYILK